MMVMALLVLSVPLGACIFGAAYWAAMFVIYFLEVTQQRSGASHGHA